MQKMKKIFQGMSADALLLTTIKLMTMVLGFATTRLLSKYLTKYEYGTYSQILLVVSTVTSVTILGMMDGINYFFCSEKNAKRRESYIATIYAMQCAVSILSGFVVMILSGQICIWLGNPGAKKLMIFAAVLPLFQNLLSMTQVLLVSVGKARMLAIRNLVVSVLRLCTAVIVIHIVQNVAIILSVSLLLDIAQVLFFLVILYRNNCYIRLRSVRFELLKNILHYCVPMAVFTTLNTLNRDCDKYVIAAFTDTETLAVYTNASKVLPFDIIMTSFTTVLLPEITRLVSNKEKKKTVYLYRSFLEISYLSTGILAGGALAVAPQLMTLLYTEKYLGGLHVFVIYILVDMVRFTNITLLLSASGQTKTLMILAVGAVVSNLGLNIVLFQWIGIDGLAVATLIVTLLTGILMLYFGAKALQAKISDFFDVKALALFVVESVVAIIFFSMVREWMAWIGDIHYLCIIAITCGMYAAVIGSLNIKRFFSKLRDVNRTR